MTVAAVPVGVGRTGRKVARHWGGAVLRVSVPECAGWGQAQGPSSVLSRVMDGRAPQAEASLEGTIVLANEV